MERSTQRVSEAVSRDPFTGVQIRIGVMGSAGDVLGPTVAELCRTLGRVVADRGHVEVFGSSYREYDVLIFTGLGRSPCEVE